MKDRIIHTLLDDDAVLKAIIGGIGDAISIQDTGLKVLYQNEDHKRLMGDHAGKHCYEAYHHRDHPCEGCPLVMVFNDGAVHTVMRSGHADAGTVFMEIMASPIKDADGNIVAGIEVARNVTDRVKADQELSESRQTLEDIAQGITESILLISKDYTIVWANEAASLQTGLSMDELVGTPCYRATHYRDRPCGPPNDPCPVVELLKTGNPVSREHTHYDKNGNKVLAEVSAYPIRDKAGDIVRFVHISKDITERKKLEQDREKLIFELQDALVNIRTLKGLIPICTSCKKIRNDGGSWEQIEAYISQHSEAEFSHGICPQCAKKLYPELVREMSEHPSSTD